ncbi:HupE/UreJ family protein [Echinicola strongylocentroti]|uniref:HupE/UreJ family protein n=1 Tax=Echinicola strongylocentroti TaxID=1795355 RepID=A0A2Z4INH3_9BACT|nr:HupE/UreJ family protein [Echinicola strongylocentroti]AWW32208.1 HupE/UreJ family protein [Echinicola strongylocentroti]
MKPIIRLFIAFLCVVLLQLESKSWAHEIRPAYLQINQTSENTYQLLWKVPRRGDMVISLRPVFPDDFTLTEAGSRVMSESAVIFHYTLTGKQPLEGNELKVHNLNKTLVDVLVNVNYQNGEKVTLMLSPDSPSTMIPGETKKWDVIMTYTILGVEHIWFGIDHLLFVLALIIITVGFKKIIKTITAFTLAHSITLSMAVLGVANLPGPPVEAVIALSIVFLASEIIKKLHGEETLTSQKPWIVAFTFGLLHGFGFAGALADVGLPQTEIPLALAFFNIGVEIGQIIFVLVILAVLKALSFKRDWPLVLKKVPAYAIGAAAAFWTIERIVGFW